MNLHKMRQRLYREDTFDSVLFILGCGVAFGWGWAVAEKVLQWAA